MGFSSAGCSSFFAFGKIYGGTRVDVKLIGSAAKPRHPHDPFPTWIYVTYGVIDIPFSLVMDTVLLPISIPWTLIKSSGDDDKGDKGVKKTSGSKSDKKAGE